ncbi:MAG TPA: PEP-CTERM sorting domain-containing protein [Verrucomicrobiae bacterium]
MNKVHYSLSALLAVAVTASAQTITLWNFNTLDGNSTTGTTAPAIGIGTASLLGGTTATFASGNAGTGSSDPETSTDDTAWNVSAFPGVTSGSGTAGALFATSTVGYGKIAVSFDLRTSNTSSRYWQFQYTTDGSLFTPFGGNTVNGVDHVFTSAGGDMWNNGWTVDLSSVAAVDNNPNFAFRVVSIFSPVGFTQTTTPSATYGPNEAYRAANTDDRAYATSGTARFDMVAVSQVPEPSVLALVSTGLLGLLARRRRSA